VHFSLKCTFFWRDSNNKLNSFRHEGVLEMTMPMAGTLGVLNSLFRFPRSAALLYFVGIDGFWILARNQETDVACGDAKAPHRRRRRLLLRTSTSTAWAVALAVALAALGSCSDVCNRHMRIPARLLARRLPLLHVAALRLRLRGGQGALECEHGRTKYVCRDCGGSSICEHSRERSTCKDCDGSAICEHQRVKRKCKDCRD